MFANERIQVDEKVNGQLVYPIYKDKITAWVTHEDARKYLGGWKFAPGKELQDDYFNGWQGYAVKPTSGADLKIVTKHIESVICKGDSLLIEYFYNWVAYTFQYPDRPAGSALVLRGQKGSGKGTIGHLIRKIWGQHGLHISNSRHLVGNFNGHLADVCFLFADEAFYSGDKQHEGVLKALITEPTLTIERKGMDAVSQPNYLKIIMVTNNDHAVSASRDERRYCVFDVASDRIGDTKYFDELRAACDSKDVQSAFLHKMLSRDITDFHPGTIPESQGLKDQRMASLDSAGQWLMESLEQGYFSTERDISSGTWKSVISSAELYSSYECWCHSRKLSHYNIVSKIKFGKYLKNIFIARKIKGDARGYIVGTLSDAISKFETYEKIDLGIELDNYSLDMFTCLDEVNEGKDFNPAVLNSGANKLHNFNFH